MLLNRAVVLSALLGSCIPFSIQTAHAEKSQFFASVDVKEESSYFYVGGVTSLSGLNLLTDNSFLIRASLGAGQYSYDTTAVVGRNVDGDIRAGDIMLGYQKYFNPTTLLTGYLGASYENQDLSPNDPNAKVKGTEGGIKAQAELQARLAPQVPMHLIATYSTGFDSYWTQANIGYDFGAATVGPEIGFQGNEAYNEQRYGASVSKINLGDWAKAKISLGHANSDRDNDSMYGNFSISKDF
jgi:hypothetical protein